MAARVHLAELPYQVRLRTPEFAKLRAAVMVVLPATTNSPLALPQQHGSCGKKENKIRSRVVTL